MDQKKTDFIIEMSFEVFLNTGRGSVTFFRGNPYQLDAVIM